VQKPGGHYKLAQAAIIRPMKPCRGAVQTITLDNDSEFAGHEAVAKAVTAAIYFSDPYCT
jgi:transposase, IS30 family